MQAVLRLYKMLKFCRCPSAKSLRSQESEAHKCIPKSVFCVFPALHFLSQHFLAWSCDQGIEFQMSNSIMCCSSVIPSLMDFIFFIPLSLQCLSSGHCCQSPARFSMTSPTLVFHKHAAISSVSPSRSPISSADMTFSQDPAYLLTSISSYSTLLSSPLSVLCLPFPSTQLH